MNPPTMTLDECRYYLAEKVGPWRRKGGRWYHAKYHRIGSGTKRHPIPATLDAIAWVMPSHQDLEIYTCDMGWGARAYLPGRERIEIVADTEILARARLAVACWEAMK